MKNYLFIILILLTVKLHPQTFTSSVDNTSVGVNDQFQISFTFSGDDVNQLKNFSPPNFNQFILLSGPNQSTSMQIINGQVSASRVFSYILRARNIGTFTIAPATVEFKNKTLKTEPLKIEVTQGSQRQQQQQQQGTVSSQQIAENVFIRAFADKQRVYRGEQVTITYKLYTALSITSPQISKLPTYPGFWAEELESPTQLNFTTEVVDGKQFRVANLKRVALFPSQSGELTVTPFELKLGVRIERQRQRRSVWDDFFDDPFFSRGETYEFTAKSNTIKINVLPLPAANVPKSFNGVVGDFSIKAEIDKNDAVVNDPLTLKISYSGNGNIKLLSAPEIKFPASLEKYDPKVNEQISRSGRISGRKTFEYLLVPRSSGKIEIPSIDFSFFNPVTNQYSEMKSESFTINITPGDGTYAANIPGVSKENIKLLGEDIRFIKLSSAGIKYKSDYTLFQIWFWLIVILPMFILTGLIIYKKKDEKLSSDIQLLRYRKAEKIAKNRLKKVKYYLEKNLQTEFYTEISLALFGYLEDKLHIPKSDFTIEKALDMLKEKNVADEQIEIVKKCTWECEFIRFSPKGDSSTVMNDMYERAVTIIINLEKSLTSNGKK